jgi:flagellar motor switch protein FliG
MDINSIARKELYRLFKNIDDKQLAFILQSKSDDEFDKRLDTVIQKLGEPKVRPPFLFKKINKL